MRVGRPAGGSSWPPRTHHPGAARPARRVVVGNLGYDVSFTLPKSYSLLPAFADSDTAAAAAVESVYTEAVGRAFGWLERQCAYGMRGQPTASSPAGVIATGPKRSRTNKPRSAETSPIALWYGDQRSGAGSVGAQAGGDQAASERAAVAAAAGG